MENLHSLDINTINQVGLILFNIFKYTEKHLKWYGVDTCFVSRNFGYKSQYAVRENIARIFDLFRKARKWPNFRKFFSFFFYIRKTFLKT